MKIIVALVVGAFFGFAATAMVSVGGRREAYEDGLRDGIKMGEESVREEYEFLAMLASERKREGRDDDR